MAIEIYERLQDVARALASLNRWEDAAPLCMEIGDAFIDTKGNAYDCAASAFQYAANHEKSIEMYLKHLVRVGLEKMNEEPHCEVLSKIFFVHHAIYEAAMSQHNQSNIGYTALLRASGFKTPGGDDFFEQMLGVEPAVLKS
jgi:hypothetical protein